MQTDIGVPPAGYPLLFMSELQRIQNVTTIRYIRVRQSQCSCSLNKDRKGPEMGSLFTVQELMDQIALEGYLVRLHVHDEEQDKDFEMVHITREDDLNYAIYLEGCGPYFEQFELYLFLPILENPHLVANIWNKGDYRSIATVPNDPITELPRFQEDHFVVELRIPRFHTIGELSDIVHDTMIIWEAEIDEFLLQFVPGYGEDLNSDEED